jgi:hypothetical protein
MLTLEKPEGEIKNGPSRNTGTMTKQRGTKNGNHKDRRYNGQKKTGLKEKLWSTKYSGMILVRN